MRFFLFSLFLLLLLDSLQGSTLPQRACPRGLNTTLKTNFDGTYRRINPCTNKEIESSSYVASHEFRHHVSGENWRDYTQKCSAIIQSFLQAIGNLIRFNSSPKGTFNFRINTSITQKQDGYCHSKRNESCRSMPTIIIEATNCDLSPESPNLSFENKTEIACISDQSTEGGQNSDETVTRPNFQEDEISFQDDCTTTTEDVFQSLKIPLRDAEYPAGSFQTENSWTTDDISQTRTAQTNAPFARSGMKTKKGSMAVDTEIPIPNQNSNFYETFTSTPQDVADCDTNGMTQPPEDDFMTDRVPPPPKPFNLENSGQFIPNRDFYTSQRRDFVTPSVPQPTTVNYEDEFIPNEYQSAPVGVDQPPNVNSKQLFNDDFIGQPSVNQRSPDSFTSPDQIPVTNLPSTDSSNLFTDKTQLERPFAYPVVSSLGEPEPVELSFSKPTPASRVSAVGPPALNHPNQLATTTPFPPTTVKPEFDELSGQGLVTRPQLTENDFFNGSRQSFSLDQTPELAVSLPPIQGLSEEAEEFEPQTTPVNPPFSSEDSSSELSGINNRTEFQVSYDNQPNNNQISQQNQQFPTGMADMSRFPYKPVSDESSDTRNSLNSFQPLPTPKIETPQSLIRTDFPAFPSESPKALPEQQPNAQIPLPYEDEPVTTPLPEFQPHDDYVNQETPASFAEPESQFTPPSQFGPEKRVENRESSQIVEPQTTVAPELQPPLDYDYQYINEGDDFDYFNQQNPNSTSGNPQNPRAFVYRNFPEFSQQNPAGRLRKFPPNFNPQQPPMRNFQMPRQPFVPGRVFNNGNNTVPQYQPEYDYQYFDESTEQQTPQFPVDVPYRRFPSFPQRHFNSGNAMQTPIQRPPIFGLNSDFQHNNRRTGRPNSGFINSQTPNILVQPEQQNTNERLPDGKFSSEEQEISDNPTDQPGLTTATYEKETVTTEFQTTEQPEQQIPLELNNIPQVPDQSGPPVQNFDQSNLQLQDNPPTGLSFPPKQPPIINLESPPSGPITSPFEEQKTQTNTQADYQPSLDDNQNAANRWNGQMSDSEYTGPETPNRFLQTGQKFRGGAPLPPPFPEEQQPAKNLETPQPSLSTTVYENKSTEVQTTAQPDYQPSEDYDNQNIENRWDNQMSDFEYTGPQVPNTFVQNGQQSIDRAPFLPSLPEVQQPVINFPNPQRGPINRTIEKETISTDIQTTEEPHYKAPVDDVNQTAEVQNPFLPSFPEGQNPTIQVVTPQNPPSTTEYEDQSTNTQSVNEYEAPVDAVKQNTTKRWDDQMPESDHIEVPNTFVQNGQKFRGGPPLPQLFPEEQQSVMNLETPQPSFTTTEYKNQSMDTETTAEPDYQPSEEYDSQNIEDEWDEQMSNSEYTETQVPNTFVQNGQQFPSSFSEEQQPMINIQPPRLTTTAHENKSTETQTTTESEFQKDIQLLGNEEQTLPENNSQFTTPPKEEFLPSPSEEKINFQRKQSSPVSGEDYENETFESEPQPSDEYVSDKTVGPVPVFDFTEQQNTFDQSQLTRNRFPDGRIFPKQPFRPNPAVPEFRPPINYNRETPRFPFRNPQNFHPQPNTPFREFPQNFFPPQQPIRNFYSPRKNFQNEAFPTGFQERKFQPSLNFPNDRRLPDRNFIMQKNPKGLPESEVPGIANFRRFPSGMQQVYRPDNSMFVPPPRVGFPPSRGFGRVVPVPGPRFPNRFPNPPNNNQPVVNGNFQPEMTLMHSDQNLDTPKSFYSSRPTPNENQPEPDIMPDVRTSDEYLTATSSEEKHTTSPPVPNTSVYYEDEEKVPLTVPSYPGQDFNDNMTTPIPNTSSLYSEQTKPVINQLSLQTPADISNSEYKNSFHSQPSLISPNPIQMTSSSESIDQEEFSGEQENLPVGREIPSYSGPSPDGNSGQFSSVFQDHVDIPEEVIDRKPPQDYNSSNYDESNSFVPDDSYLFTDLSSENQDRQLLNGITPETSMSEGTTPPPFITTTTSFKQDASESSDIATESPAGLQQDSDVRFQVVPPVPSIQSFPTVENPVNDKPPKDIFLSTEQFDRIPPPSETATAFNFEKPERQKKPFANRNNFIDRPKPVFGTIRSSSQPVTFYHQQLNQSEEIDQVQQGLPYLENQQQTESIQQFSNNEQIGQGPSLQQPSGIPPLNRQGDNSESSAIETRQMTSERPFPFPPQPQSNSFPPEDVRQFNLNLRDSFPPMDEQPIEMQTNQMELPTDFSIPQPQIISDSLRTEPDSSVNYDETQENSQVDSQSVVSGDDQSPPETSFPALSPPPHSNRMNNAALKFSNQQQFGRPVDTFDQFPSTAAPKFTSSTSEMATATDYSQSTYNKEIPAQPNYPKFPVNAPIEFPHAPTANENSDFIYPEEVPPPVTKPTPPLYTPDINPAPQPPYVQDKIPANSSPSAVETQPSFDYATLQDYQTTDSTVETYDNTPLEFKPETLPENQEVSTNSQNSEQKFNSDLNIPPPDSNNPERYNQDVTFLDASEMVSNNPTANIQQKFVQQKPQNNLKFINDFPPQQPNSEIEMTENESSSATQPNPQTSFNNAGSLLDHNTTNILVDQQEVTSPSEFDVTPPMTYDVDGLSEKSQPPPEELVNDSLTPYITPPTQKSKTVQTFDQQIITTDYPRQKTPQPVLITRDQVSLRRNPFYNPQEFQSPERQTNREGTAFYNQFTTPPLNEVPLYQQNPVGSQDGRVTSINQQQEENLSGAIIPVTPPMVESQPKELERTQPSPDGFDYRTTEVPPQEFIFSGQNVNENEKQLRSDSLVLGTPSYKPETSAGSEVSEQVSSNRQSGNNLNPLTTTAILEPLVTKPSTKTKIVEEVITAELPKAITDSPIKTQLAFAEKLLHYEDKKLSSLQQNTKPPVAVENQNSTESSSYSEVSNRSNHQLDVGKNSFVENFEKDNEQLEGSSRPNQVSSYTPESPQPVILEKPTSPFDDYDHSIRSPDMYSEYDEIPPNFNARTNPPSDGNPEGSQLEFASFDFPEADNPGIFTSPSNEPHANPLFHTLESHLNFPLHHASQPPATLLQPSVGPSRTSSLPNDSLSGEPRNVVSSSSRRRDFEQNFPSSQQPARDATSTPRPGFLDSYLTTRSKTPGEDYVSCSPLHCPFNPDLKGNMSAPCYYILISKPPLEPEKNEHFRIEKVYLGDGTPLNCTLNAWKTFPTALYTPIPHRPDRTSTGRVAYRPLRNPR